MPLLVTWRAVWWSPSCGSKLFCRLLVRLAVQVAAQVLSLASGRLRLAGFVLWPAVQRVVSPLAPLHPTALRVALLTSMRAYITPCLPGASGNGTRTWTPFCKLSGQLVGLGERPRHWLERVCLGRGCRRQQWTVAQRPCGRYPWVVRGDAAAGVHAPEPLQLLTLIGSSDNTLLQCGNASTSRASPTLSVF